MQTPLAYDDLTWLQTYKLNFNTFSYKTDYTNVEYRSYQFHSNLLVY